MAGILQWFALAALAVAGCVSAADAQQYDSVEDLFVDNTDPTGIWSDGNTMWVLDYVDNKIYAYDISTRSPVPSKDFTLPAAGNNIP